MLRRAPNPPPVLSSIRITAIACPRARAFALVGLSIGQGTGCWSSNVLEGHPCRVDDDCGDLECLASVCKNPPDAVDAVDAEVASGDEGSSSSGDDIGTEDPQDDSGSELSNATEEASDGTGGEQALEPKDDRFRSLQYALKLQVSAPGVLENDAGDGLRAVAATLDSAQGGRLSLEENGAFEYRAAAPGEFWGQERFEYEVVDLHGVKKSAHIDITVSPQVVSAGRLEEGRSGFTIDGRDVGDQLGLVASALGDINGDAIDDLAFTAPGERGDTGSAYILYGREHGRWPSRTDLESGKGGFVMHGASLGERAGVALCPLGDVNADGNRELAIGAETFDGARGRVYIVYGVDEPRSPIDLGAVVEGRGGYVIERATGAELFGGRLASVPDINDDSVPELLITARDFGPVDEEYGAAFLVYGADRSSSLVLEPDVPADIGFSIVGGIPNGHLGFGVSAFDLDRDGAPELMLSTYRSGDERGSLFVLNFGGSYREAQLDRPQDSDLIFAHYQGEHPEARLGRRVQGVGDLNGDGYEELAFSSYRGGLDKTILSRIFVVFGGVRGSLPSLYDLYQGVGGFVIESEALRDQFGYFIGSAGDFNGDGFGDLVMSANMGHSAGEESGTVYVAYGGEDLSSISLAELHGGVKGFVIHGHQPNDRAGIFVGQAGDIQGDGYSDLVFSADVDNVSVENSPGRLYVMFGGPYGE